MPHHSSPHGLMLILATAALALTLLSGCGDVLDVKLGGQGESCQADRDCRAELLCIKRSCTADGEANNDANNGGDDYEVSCSGVCDYIVDCGIDELNCVSDCTSETANWSPSGMDAAFSCLLELSCNELGQERFYDECKDLRFGGEGKP